MTTTRDKLVAALRQCMRVIDRADTSEGVCGCGEPMDSHTSPMDAGHAPVDIGDWEAESAMRDALEALELAQEDDQPEQSATLRLVPIEKRMPDFDAGSVLVYTAYHDFGGVQYHQIDASELYTALDPEAHTPWSEVARVATHWMSLPVAGGMRETT